VNPRVIETRVGDGTNTKKTQIDYELFPSSSVAVYGRVSEVRVYDADLSTVLKKSVTDYEDGPAYVTRRLVNLPTLQEQRDGSDTLWSKVTYAYDTEGFDQETNQTPSVIKHDSAYGSTFVAGRGNLTSVTRHDVLSQSSAAVKKIRYDIAGNVVSQLDPLNRKVRFEYDDVFNDTTTARNTFAYPTKIFDQAGNYSQIKYRFDVGENVWAKGPDLSGTVAGKETTRELDDKGRISKETVVNSGAYKRYQYFTNGAQLKTFATLVDVDSSNSANTADEVESETLFDGAGRVRASRAEHPGSTGGWSATLTEYDILGRIKRSTVPTEVDNSWVPAGDDYRGMNGSSYVWLWNSQEYDWKGRTTRAIPTDSNGTDGKDTLYNYEGCGCAGGLVTTVQGPEVPRTDTTGNERRTHKIYQDILGRTTKTENYEWDGTTVYSTSATTFNGRDQATLVREYAGSDSSSTYQDTALSYDGHGR
jgi:hypothetical protein